MKVVIMGLQGTGKTHLVKHFFLKGTPYHLVFDPNNEYDGFMRYVPHQKSLENYEILSDEVRLMCRKIIFPNIWSIEKANATGKEKEKRLRLIVFDEADLVMPARTRFNQALRNLWVNSRHYRVDLIAITRRPTDLNTYVMDTADYLIIFNITGHNALRVMKDINSTAADAVRSLDYNSHEFLVFDRTRQFRKYTLDTITEEVFK